jgi:hypothetical protein
LLATASFMLGLVMVWSFMASLLAIGPSDYRGFTRTGNCAGTMAQRGTSGQALFIGPNASSPGSVATGSK